MLRALDRSEWQLYCENISDALQESEAGIEVDSVEIGAQVAVRSLPLIGITYDRNDDIIDIAFEGFDHIIEHPRELCIDASPEAVSVLEIIDKTGAQHIVKLKEKLLLARPH